MKNVYLLVTAIVIFAQGILFCAKKLMAVTSGTELRFKSLISSLKWLRMVFAIAKQFC